MTVVPLVPRRLSLASVAFLPHYALLSGNTHYARHCALAHALVAHIKTVPGVELILGLGSLARGFADAWSDIDLAVVGRGLPADRLLIGEQWYNDLCVDWFPVDLAVAPSVTWDAARCQAFEESVVLWAKDESIIIQIQGAVRLTTKERQEHLAELFINLGVQGYAARAWLGHFVHGYYWSVPPCLWLQRGCPVAAHAQLDEAGDLVCQLLYMANRHRIPDRKWRLFLVPALDWVPPSWRAWVALAQEARTVESARQRSDALLDCVDALAEYCAIRDDLVGDFLPAHLNHAPYWNPWRAHD